MPDPAHGHAFAPRLLDQALDVGHDRVSCLGLLDDAVLDVDDEERGMGPVGECGHRLCHGRPSADPYPERAASSTARISSTQRSRRICPMPRQAASSARVDGWRAAIPVSSASFKMT